LPDSNMTAVVSCGIEGKQIVQTKLLPVLIDEDSRPQWLSGGDSAFQLIASQLREVSASEKLETLFTEQSHELHVSSAIKNVRGSWK